MAQSQGQRSKELARGLFSKLKETKMRVDSNWEREGNYISRIDNVKLDTNRKKEVALFIEKTVIAVLDDADGTGHKVGDSITHALWEKHESFLGNVKAFLATTTGADSEEIDEEHVFLVVDDDQPLNGTFVENNNRKIRTKEKGNPFTLVNYVREVPASELGEILDENAKARFFPEGLLEQMIALEEGEED